MTSAIQSENTTSPLSPEGDWQPLGMDEADPDLEGSVSYQDDYVDETEARPQALTYEEIQAQIDEILQSVNSNPSLSSDERAQIQKQVEALKTQIQGKS